MCHYKGLLIKINLDCGAKSNPLITKIVNLDGTVKFTVNRPVQFYKQPLCSILLSTIPFNFTRLDGWRLLNNKINKFCLHQLVSFIHWIYWSTWKFTSTRLGDWSTWNLKWLVKLILKQNHPKNNNLKKKTLSRRSTTILKN